MLRQFDYELATTPPRSLSVHRFSNGGQFLGHGRLVRDVTHELEAAGHTVSPPTVGRLLRKRDYSLHVNAKKMEASSNHPDRGRQFDYIAVQRATFTAAGLPIISTDSKKRRRRADG
jgi:Rhodopirellula transposase DDE domain